MSIDDTQQTLYMFGRPLVFRKEQIAKHGPDRASVHTREMQGQVGQYEWVLRPHQLSDMFSVEGECRFYRDGWRAKIRLAGGEENPPSDDPSIFIEGEAQHADPATAIEAASADLRENLVNARDHMSALIPARPRARRHVQEVASFTPVHPYDASELPPLEDDDGGICSDHD